MLKLSFRAPRPFELKLCDEKNFYEAFVDNIKQASLTIMIESPFICYRRAAYLLPHIVRALDRGVSIQIITRNPNEHEGSMTQQAQSIVDMFENIGVDVQYVRKTHRKTAIIDKHILWDGSLNILSQAYSREVMRRIVSRNECRAMKNCPVPPILNPPIRCNSQTMLRIRGY